MNDESFKVSKGFRLHYSEEDGKRMFFTSDTHFNHANIIKFCSRPFSDVTEMNDELVRRWNSVVGTDDTVFHLGDFAWGGAPLWSEILERLNGNKILILGNHDMKNLTQGVASKYFDTVLYQTSIYIGKRKVYLNHYPFLTYSGIWRKDSDKVFQLYGHVHSGPLSSNGKDMSRIESAFPTQYDVGVDNNDYTPVSWERVNSIILKNLEEHPMGDGGDE